MSDDNTQGGAEPPPASAGSHGPLFSERFEMGNAAYEWCATNNAPVSVPVNIVTALFALGLVVKRPVLTDKERRSIEAGIANCEDITYGGPNDEEAAAVLRLLLERLG